ncbi:hypothetical protein GOODEAATRI_034103 [Goodea atripinnis]|uniref:Uncharacterized protein n=1 Tax=Goodea atripinnis TaxID=208336 RepID=A0ABV0PA26_9TELE
MAIYKLPEGETLGDSSVTSPNSKTTTSDGVSPSSSSDSSSDTSVVTTPPSWISRFNEVRPKKRRNCKSPANGMYSVPIWSLMATTPCSVYSDSLSSKTSSDSVYPASSCSKTSATNGVSSVSLKSEASTPEGEFCDQTQRIRIRIRKALLPSTFLDIQGICFGVVGAIQYKLNSINKLY